MLFKRSKQEVRLTSDEEAMLGYARAILQIADQARRHFAQPPLEGWVRFGMVEDFAATALASVLGRLRRQHPHFELTTEVGLSTDLLRRFGDGRSRSHLEQTRVRSQPRPSPWAAETCLGRIAKSFGRTIPLALYPAPSTSREIMLQALREHGRRWSVRYESRS